MTRSAPERRAAPSGQRPRENPRPVFGFMLFGGPLSGALVRDVRLANELAARGFGVHVWWVMDQRRSAPLRSEIRQHWLFHGLRYYYSTGGSTAMELFGRAMTRVLHEKNRLRAAQKRPKILHRVMVGLIERVCRGPEGDERLMRRFTRQIEQAGVTHLLPMLSILGPWVAAARSRIERPLDYLVTFQGYELYVNYAREIGREETLYEKLREAVGRSSYPAIAVSRDYADRVVEDLGIPAASLQAIPPGVPTEFGFDPARAREVIRQSGLVGPLDLDTPLVTFLGRRDTEKGIDLLLYAAAILRRRGLKFHLAVCGPTLFGDHYSRVCRQLAVDLRIPVTWRNFISDELRSALFTGSRCIVYPSIHREPFGMVAVEALAHGTPCVVPDYGGISAAIEANGRVGGVRFRAWDSADLAAAIERLLTDDELHGRLSAEGPSIATYYSVENLADRVLRHMGLPARPQCATDNPEETD